MSEKLIFKHGFKPKSVDELTPSQRAQFEVFRIAEKDVELLDWVDVFDERGKRVYEMVLKWREEGGVFEIGTTDEICSFVQGGVNECDDEDLGERLQEGFDAFDASGWPR
jgi:hypothetical protein